MRAVPVGLLFGMGVLLIWTASSMLPAEANATELALPISPQPSWLDAEGRPTRAAQAFMGAFASADARGLRPTDYFAADWPERLAALGSSSAQQREVVAEQFSASARRLLGDLRLGRVWQLDAAIDPGDAAAASELPGLLQQLAVRLERADDPAGELTRALDALEPPYPGYRRLRNTLQQYLSLAAEQDTPSLADLAGDVVEPGAVYPDADELARWLWRLGDLADTRSTFERIGGDRVAAYFSDGLGLIARIAGVQAPSRFAPWARGMPAELAAPVTQQFAGWLQARAQPSEDSPAVAEIPRYHERLVAAVTSFQSRHGLLADGRIGRRTLQALRTPLSLRVRQLQLAMERWRRAPRDISAPPIVVNIPEFRLRAYDDSGRVALEMNVVVGAAFQRQTPVFASELRTVVLRPYWNVPLSIVRRDLLPRLRADHAYLADHGYEIVGTDPDVASTLAIDDELFDQLRRGRLGLRQQPGDSNSLGLVKFLFPNEHSVYLHDTPSKGLFARARRDLSSGCIRVQDPLALAAWVLRRQPEWNRERIEQAMVAGDDNQAVRITPAIPLYLVYVTAVVPESGAVHFFDDIYGHDARLWRQLQRRQADQ